MRIKCPNSDIVLELPGDRTDMKFTCPACHKVHRVTITISTPGEDPPPAPSSPNTRSVTRSQPQMPKKYATGAFAPVVDIPIDANFVLVDAASGGQPGIDLGRAADSPPPFADREFASRKTEIMPDRRPESERRSAPPPPPPFQAAPEPPMEAKRPASTPEPAPEVKTEEAEESVGSRWDKAAAAPPPPPPPPPPPVGGRDGDFDAEDVVGEYHEEPEEEGLGVEAPRRGGGRGLLVVLLLAVLAAGGYLGWQQYLHNNARKNAEELLGWADTAWNRGEATAAADNARSAGEILAKAAVFNTPGNLWNRLAAWTGWFEPGPSGAAEAERRAKTYMERERTLGSFRDAIDPDSVRGMADLLRETAPAAASDPALLAAMESAVTSAALERLEAAADSAAPEAVRARAQEEADILTPVLSAAGREKYSNRISSFNDSQRRRLSDEIRSEAASVAAVSSAGDRETLDRYRALAFRMRNAAIPELPGTPVELGDGREREALRQLDTLSGLVEKAETYARTVLSRADGDEATVERLAEEARGASTPNPAIAETAARMVRQAGGKAPSSPSSPNSPSSAERSGWLFCMSPPS